MTDKLYNGFNNGRDKSDGVGGREVNHGTQETMTKEQILESRISCTCNEAYKSRQMADPDCGRCNWYEEILQCMSEWESQQLSAERERAGKLVEALKSIDRINYSQNISDIIEQTLNEYDTATKES